MMKVMNVNYCVVIIMMGGNDGDNDANIDDVDDDVDDEVSVLSPLRSGRPP
jgi:hypothetical protein